MGNGSEVNEFDNAGTSSPTFCPWQTVALWDQGYPMVGDNFSPCPMTTSGDTVDTFKIHYHHERAFVDSVEFSRLLQSTSRESWFSRSQPSNPRLCLIWVFKRPKGIYVLAVMWGPWKKSMQDDGGVSQTLGGQIHSFATCSCFCK